MKTHFPRTKPNMAYYSGYKGFLNAYFRSELLQEINAADSGITNFNDLNDTLKRVLDKKLFP